MNVVVDLGAQTRIVVCGVPKNGSSDDNSEKEKSSGTSAEVAVN